jgi:hypothetical protein
MMLWRYMDVAKYVAMLSRGLHFCRPSALGDPWEGAWAEPNVTQFRTDYWGRPGEGLRTWDERRTAKRQLLERFGISCWHRSDYESAALWALYVPQGFGVAIRSTDDRIIQSLLPASRDIRCLEVAYVDYAAEPLPDDPSVLLARKRLAFEHDKEVRFLVEHRKDEQDAIDDWQLLLQDLRKRHISLSPVGGGLVRPAPTPARVVTDDTLRDRATPAGVYLVTDMPTLIEKVCLAPNVSVPVRHAVLAATERFGLDRHVISESETDLVPPDEIAFFP